MQIGCRNREIEISRNEDYDRFKQFIDALDFISHFSGRFFTLFWATRVGEAVCLAMAMSLLNGEIINQLMLLRLWFYDTQIGLWGGLGRVQWKWRPLIDFELASNLSDESIEWFHENSFLATFSLPTDHPQTSFCPQSTSPPIVVIFFFSFLSISNARSHFYKTIGKLNYFFSPTAWSR